MIATMDKAGRIVIPKPLRDKMGLQPGVPLRVDYIDGQITIEYEPAEWSVEKVNGFSVLRSSADGPTPTLTDEMIREAKEASYREREARWV